jgi:hypothetical protein
VIDGKIWIGPWSELLDSKRGRWRGKKNVKNNLSGGKQRRYELGGEVRERQVLSVGSEAV